MVMSLSIVPYLLFLYLIWRIYRLEPRLLHRTTFIGFLSMLGFVALTACAGFVALRVMGATTLAHVDWLHGLAEAGLTLTNGLIALGLKKQLDAIELAELDEDEEDAPVLTGVAADGAYPDAD
jgi:hypothetical protein